MAKLKYQVGDTVVVRSGRLKGKSGKITQIHPSENSVTIEGLNVYKRHRKQSQSTKTAGVYEMSVPIKIDKLGILNPSKKNKPSKIGFDFDSKGNKKRIYKATGKEIK